MKKFLAIVALALTPVVASAASGIQVLLASISSTLGALVYIIMSLGLVVFLWGIVQYVIAGSDDKKDAAKHVMMWGIIGLFVMSTVWGIVGLLASTIWSDPSAIGQPPQIPSVPTVTAS